MSFTDSTGNRNNRPGLLASIPLLVLVVAVLAALLHILPYWHAQIQTPPGWTFTGNIHSSPDYMQYRVWTRQTEQTGVLVSNKFTTEPNVPYLPVFLYYAIGQVSRWTQVAPEFVYAYAGSLFAFVLTILLFVIVRQFMRTTYRTWWVLAVILLGGGLGAHLKLLAFFDIVKNNFVLKQTLVEGLAWPTFEDYRGNYVFISLFDTHFLLIWVLSAAAVFALYLALNKPSLWRMLLAASLFAASTLLHLYEGVTLIAIMMGVAVLSWRKGLLSRSAVATMAACTLAVAIAFGWQFLLYRFSGLPTPTWRGVNILFSTLLISYPVAWVLIAWGVADYWRQANFDRVFLLGWALGCTVLTLSGPFYPYPDRGTMTLQIPLYIVAGDIYFSKYARVTALPAVVAFLVLAATPIWTLAFQWKSTNFTPDEASMFLSPAHREIIDVVRQRATENDVLIVDKTDAAWQTDDLWLAPEYPGKLYCGHFFLTPDYDRKCAQVNSFFNAPASQVSFLKENGIRFVYVAGKDDPSRFESVPGLIPLKSESIGALFEFTPSTVVR
ncbi:MAG TPA: hypothetical protein VF932_08160 [Anaerolineae bacterium]